MMIMCWLLVLHFVADFLLQSREMGKNKSSKFSVLLAHLAIQYFVIAFGMLPLIFYIYCQITHIDMFSIYAVPLYIMAAFKCFVLSGINAVIHGIIDWNIWRLYKLSAYLRIKREIKENGETWDDVAKASYEANMVKNWQYWEDHWFYATIGFDQLLHGLTLVFIAGLMML